MDRPVVPVEGWHEGDSQLKPKKESPLVRKKTGSRAAEALASAPAVPAGAVSTITSIDSPPTTLLA